MKRVVQQFVTSALISCCVLLVGCASIISGKEQSLYVDSTPASAVVTLNGMEAGKTPVQLSLLRKSAEAVVAIELDGFEPQEITLARKTNGWVWGNILLGGIIGLAIDLSTGAMYAYKLPTSTQPTGTTEGVKNRPEGVDIWINVVLKPDPKLTMIRVGQLVPLS